MHLGFRGLGFRVSTGWSALASQRLQNPLISGNMPLIFLGLPIRIEGILLNSGVLGVSGVFDPKP